MVFGKKIMVIIELRKAFFALQMLKLTASEFGNSEERGPSGNKVILLQTCRLSALVSPKLFCKHTSPHQGYEHQA